MIIVYRITLEKWSSGLSASAYPARWNSKGKSMIYTAGSRALACLENVVHRSGEGLTQKFKVMVIEIPDNLDIEIIDAKDLPADWHEYIAYRQCQQIGDAWLDRLSTAVLRVPSAIIREERNFLLNPGHPDFQKIKLVGTEDFFFDERIKGKAKPKEKAG